MSNIINEKSEILYFYDSTFCMPNGDPFTGEQRYDEETKKILISDVRIKRYIRDYFIDLNSLSNESKLEVYVLNDLSQANTTEQSGSSARMKSLRDKYDSNRDNDDPKKGMAPKELLLKCIDARLFGGISTEKEKTVNLTGPVQFALLNPSLNEVDLKIHQNTSVFVSSTEKSQGAIGTTSLVPYAVNQIHGWINPFSAKLTELTREDINLMFRALWESINNKNTRSKANQNSLLLLEIVYAENTKKCYNISETIKIEYKEDKKGETIRNINDYSFNFEGLQKLLTEPIIKEIRYYTEIEEIKSLLNALSENNKLVDLKEIIYPTN